MRVVVWSADGLAVMIAALQAVDPGSTPGQRRHLNFLFI